MSDTPIDRRLLELGETFGDVWKECIALALFLAQVLLLQLTMTNAGDATL